MGHGRALLETNTIRRRQARRRKCAREEWSVRRLESVVHTGSVSDSDLEEPQASSGSRATLAAQDLASNFTEHLGTRATIPG